MSAKYIGKGSFRFETAPKISAWASAGAAKEADGPLARYFDYLSDDAYFGQSTWEKAEAELHRHTLELALTKAKISVSELGMIFAGDLQNQCTASSFGSRYEGVPYFGLYGACSTFAEAIILAAMAVDGGFIKCGAAAASSHFCSAERQFRLPLEYGGQRTPTAQWTVTGAGAVVITASDSAIANGGEESAKPKLVQRITSATPGIIRDAGIKDAANMGAAMAVAAYETLYQHFEDTGRDPSYYDLIVTGDLAKIGFDIVTDFFSKSGTELTNYNDCGLLIYDRETQDVHSGGSGAGCSASVLCSYLLNEMRSGAVNKLLFAGTGALMSAITSGQGESIPGICHAVSIENFPEDAGGDQ
ncbi:MAG: stage V sporulation protein AD [Oscillospiraceae bacterium]|jgi:stage V sporulation protein AD|nr:stage V sporulation protein AD [Oscillospiraceae bacterium]